MLCVCKSLTLSGPTLGEFSRIQSKIHASDKYILRFISVRSMSGPEGVKFVLGILLHSRQTEVRASMILESLLRLKMLLYSNAMNCQNIEADVNKVDDNLGETLDKGLEDDLNDAIGMKSKYVLYSMIRNGGMVNNHNVLILYNSLVDNNKLLDSSVVRI